MIALEACTGHPGLLMDRNVVTSHGVRGRVFPEHREELGAGGIDSLFAPHPAVTPNDPLHPCRTTASQATSPLPGQLPGQFSQSAEHE